MSEPSHHHALSTSPIAGEKRPAPGPSLLPAFEPLSSSPVLPRPSSRLTHAAPQFQYGPRNQMLPTPVPTSSSTLIPSSSPPRPGTNRRGTFQRTASTLSERAPLSTVPSIELSKHGEPTLMGRSSNSSHYQLSTNKLISRVHVRAEYLPAAASSSRKVRIECTGWNGAKVHCMGKAWDLAKGSTVTFTSESEDADIMVDVLDARVLVTWPRNEPQALTPTDSDGNSWDGENSPTRRTAAGARNQPVTMSPLRQHHRLQSPVSPSPAVNAAHVAPSGHMISNPPVQVPVQVYEDEPSDEEHDRPTQPTQSTQMASQSPGAGLKSSQISLATEPDSFSDNDEENDPIITSFGPYGDNLHARMQTFNTSISPEFRRPLNPLKEESISPQRRSHMGPPLKRRRISEGHGASRSMDDDANDKAIVNHMINHLMYSALSTTPLSTLLQSVPLHLRSSSKKGSSSSTSSETDLSSAKLQSLLESTPCIGAVERAGKDAAGKRLESEYYYMPEQDDDEGRREMVQGLGMGSRGLRNCRKSHKQYYWRKPK